MPFLIPTAVILLIMRAGNVMNLGFEKVYLMQNPLNTSISEVISTYVYKIGMISNQYSLAAAVNLFNTVINFVLLLLVNGFSKNLETQVCGKRRNVRTENFPSEKRRMHYERTNNT